MEFTNRMVTDRYGSEYYFHLPVADEDILISKMRSAIGESLCSHIECREDSHLPVGYITLDVDKDDCSYGYTLAIHEDLKDCPQDSNMYDIYKVEIPGEYCYIQKFGKSTGTYYADEVNIIERVS